MNLLWTRWMFSHSYWNDPAMSRASWFQAYFLFGHIKTETLCCWVSVKIGKLLKQTHKIPLNTYDSFSQKKFHSFSNLFVKVHTFTFITTLEDFIINFIYRPFAKIKMFKKLYTAKPEVEMLRLVSPFTQPAFPWTGDSGQCWSHLLSGTCCYIDQSLNQSDQYVQIYSLCGLHHKIRLLWTGGFFSFLNMALTFLASLIPRTFLVPAPE